MECDEPLEITPGQGEFDEEEADAQCLKEEVEDDDDGSCSSSSTKPRLPQQTVHAEVRLTRSGTATREIVCHHIEVLLRSKGTCTVPLFIDSFSDPSSACATMKAFFVDNVVSISLSTEDSDCPLNYSAVDSLKSSPAAASVDLKSAYLAIHVYRLVSGDEADPTHETIEVSSEVIKGGTRWLLPSPEFDGLWDSLVYDSTVKRDLLKYSESALLFSDYEVSHHVITWNRVIFLHGPPGTGKTSLCRALAQKICIRLSHRFSSAALIEINTVNLMSKWFSESARLVSQMFSSILEYLEEPDHLVCLLVDEVESLTAVRKSVASACEPSDAIRVVNAVLTHLDQLKHHPNVLVMATSNVTGVLDPAFLDRADIRAFIGPPSAVAIYAIYCSCLNELIRVGLIQRQKSGFLSYRVLSALQFADNSITASSLAVWQLAQRSFGLNGRTLRKLPLLAHAFHMRSFHSVTIQSTTARLADHFNKATSVTSSKDCGVEKHTTAPRGGPGRSGIPLDAFVDALERAVAAQMSDRRLLEESMSESQMGSRIKGEKTTAVAVNL